MRPISMILAVACAASVIGCQDAEQPEPDVEQTNPQQNDEPANPQQNGEKVETPRNDGAATHVITGEAVYYKGGPQQAQPQDGTFQDGTRVTVIDGAGSYSLVRSADGIEAYVASDALRTIGDEANPDLKTLVNGNNDFACDLYAQLRSKPGNLFFSPNSISTALAMTYAGASAEIRHVVSRRSFVRSLDCPARRFYRTCGNPDRMMLANVDPPPAPIPVDMRS